MVVLKDFNTIVTSENQYYEKVKGNQLDNHTIVAFHRIGSQYIYAWQLIQWDDEIIDGAVGRCSMRADPVDPNGFIFNDEIYKIEADAYV